MSEIKDVLTSLPNWSQWFNDETKATVGQHTLKVKAKGSGYRDSNLSTAVTFNIYAVSTTVSGCTASYASRLLQYTDLVIVLTAKEGFTFTNTTISTAQIKIGSTAYTPTSADTYVVSTDGTTATLTINAEAVIGNIAVTVALTEKLATPTEFTVTKGLASWNSVDKATAYEFVAVDSNNVGSSIGSYMPPAKMLSGTWMFNTTLNIQGYATPPVPSLVDNKELINFTSDGTAYNAFVFFGSRDDALTYLNTDSMTQNYAYEDGFSRDKDRTIYFGTTPQTVTDEFYNWFTANAIKQ